MKTHQNTTIKLTKNYTHFTQDERNELAILLKKDYSLRSIADVLNRSPSSVSREVKENGVNGIYDPKKAQAKANVKRWKSKFQGMKIRKYPEVEAYIHERIKRYWSPEDIAKRLKKEKNFSITAKAIYKYIHNNPFGYGLEKYLKYQGKKWKRSKSPIWGEIIKNRVFIDDRPDVINDRERIGDYEADTMGKPRGTTETLAVIRDRMSRKMFAKKVPGLKYAMNGYKKLIQDLPVCSMTFDNGVENTRYEELSVDSYFCHPFSSWEKGSVENGIGCIRRFIPKKSDLADYSQQKISAIVEIFNNKPMRCLNYQTPNEVFEEHVAQSSHYS